MRLALADMSGGVVHVQQLPLPENVATGTALQDYLVQALDGLLAAAGQGWDKIRAAAFGIPGVVDPADGTVSDLVAPLQGCEAALSKAALAELFPVPVVTENDVNLAAMAEYSGSGAAAGQSLLYFSIGEGTGGGLIIQGEIYRGYGGGAGELANLMLSAGRLEEVLSADGLLRLAAQKAGEHGNPAETRLAETAITAEQLIGNVRQGEPLALAVIDAYCSLLAEAVGSICAVMAPGTIILGGELGRHGDVLLPRLEARLSGLQRKPRLAASGNGDRDVVLGAVQIAVQSAFRHLRDMREQ